jgi:polar amino acid transport system permease protein
MDYVFHWRVITDNLDLFLDGIWLTVQLAAVTCVLGILVGVLGAAAMVSGFRPLVALTRGYVEVIRNTPLLVQLFFVFFGLPSLGFRLNAAEAAVLTLSLHVGAYATEIIRAGIEAVPRGLLEAADALALSRFQRFRFVVLPQALRRVYPALSSQFIILLLDTSIVSLIGAEDLTSMGYFLESRTFRSFEIFFTITLIYLALSFLFRRAFGLAYRVTLAKGG